jgi:hypothetical protein
VRELNKLVQLEPKDQLGRKLRDLLADKTHKDNNSAIAMASNVTSMSVRIPMEHSISRTFPQI